MKGGRHPGTGTGGRATAFLLLAALLAGGTHQPTTTSSDTDYAGLFGAGSGVAYAT